MASSQLPQTTATVVLSTDSHRVVFDMRVLVHGCSNIPHHTNARVYCKWKLSGATASKTMSRSGRLPSVETTTANLAAWDTTIDVPSCVFRVDRDSMRLQSAILRLSIRQESRVVLQGFTRLGVVRIDLADFAGQAATDRTYLLEKARLNSTLSVTVYGAQVGGDVMFRRRSADSTGPPQDAFELRSQLQRSMSNKAVSASSRYRRQVHGHECTSSDTVYQVVGDILRMSEESRTSRNSSQAVDLSQS